MVEGKGKGSGVESSAKSLEFDDITHHTVSDFIADPKLKLESAANMPWKNPDENKTPTKIAVALLGVFFIYLLTPSVDTLTWAQSFFENKLHFLCVATYVCGLFAYLLPTFTYYALYFFNFEFMEKYKVDKTTQWTWNTSQVLSEFFHVFFGQVVYGPITLYVSLVVLPTTIDLRPETVPSWYMQYFWLYVGAVVFEIFFYWFHRLAHSSSFFYEKVHRLHHDLKPCYGLGSQYHHPLDSVLTQWLPFHIAGNILHLHISTSILLSIYLTMIGVDEHSGYSFPFSPFRLFYGNADPDFHYFHHTHGGMGNYASPVMDWVFGSDMEFRAMLKKKETRLRAAAENAKSHQS
jgi:sterol desaturase/sphingolipid hydroxylase (fatty acid hydroxylase superfamily)